MYLCNQYYLGHFFFFFWYFESLNLGHNSEMVRQESHDKIEIAS